MGDRIPHGTTEADFWKMFSSPRKREVLIFSPGLYGGLYGHNLPYKFKNSYGDFRNRDFEKSHSFIELLVPGQIWDWIGDPGQIMV